MKAKKTEMTNREVYNQVGQDEWVCKYAEERGRLREPGSRELAGGRGGGGGRISRALALHLCVRLGRLQRTAGRTWAEGEGGVRSDRGER
jgi:hypothetical protein